jgi:hypothetical protein
MGCKFPSVLTPGSFYFIIVARIWTTDQSWLLALDSWLYLLKHLSKVDEEAA